MITRAYVWAHVCLRDTNTRVSALRICICNRYAMAEIACYHWALALSNASWTGLGHAGTRRGVGMRVFWARGWHGGIPAAVHALGGSHFSVRFSDRLP